MNRENDSLNSEPTIHEVHLVQSAKKFIYPENGLRSLQHNY